MKINNIYRGSTEGGTEVIGQLHISEEYMDNGGVECMFRSGTVALHYIHTGNSDFTLVSPVYLFKDTDLVYKGAHVFEDDFIVIIDKDKSDSAEICGIVEWDIDRWVLHCHEIDTMYPLGDVLGYRPSNIIVCRICNKVV